jgi:hypothetical protein
VPFRLPNKNSGGKSEICDNGCTLSESDTVAGFMTIEDTVPFGSTKENE